MGKRPTLVIMQEPAVAAALTAHSGIPGAVIPQGRAGHGVTNRAEVAAQARNEKPLFVGIFPHNANMESTIHIGCRVSTLLANSLIKSNGRTITGSSDHAIINASAHIQKLIQDCMHNTFFTVEGVPGVCHTTRGTRPGDPLGDLLLNLIMRLVLHDMHAKVQQGSRATWLGAPTHCSSFADAEDIPLHAYFDVSFVDDAAVAIHAETLPDVEGLIKLVVESFHAAARARGL